MLEYFNKKFIMSEKIKKYKKECIIIITGAVNSSKINRYIDFLNEINLLKIEGIITDIYIENHSSIKKFIDKKLIIDNKIKYIDDVISSDIKRDSNENNDYLKKISILKKRKRIQLINKVLKDYDNKNEIYILFARSDIILEKDLIKEYVYSKPIPNNLFKDKLWVSSADVVKPFYINDLFIFGHIDDIKKISNFEIESQKHCFGFQHQREFISPFIDEYPVFRDMLNNNYSFNSRLYAKELKSSPEIIDIIFSSAWTRNIIVFYQYLLNRYFTIKGKRFEWLDASGKNRDGKFFNTEYIYNQNLDLLSNIKRNTKYDATLYIYEQIKNIKMNINSLFNHREKFDLFIKFLNYEKINYVIIRGYKKLPITPDTDIDIVYDEKDEERFLEIVKLFWDVNKNTILNNIFDFECKYTQWWTSGEPDKSIANMRFTMDTYNHFFFHVNNQFCLEKNQEKKIFHSKIKTYQGFYIPKPEYELILLGYRSYYDQNKAFKEKHLNLIFEIIKENKIDFDDLKNDKNFGSELKIINYVEEKYNSFFNKITMFEI